MKLLSLLGNMPASTSGAWTLNELDGMKILRTAVMAFVGPFILSFAIGLQGINFTEILTFQELGQVLLTVLTSAAVAGGAALSTAIADAVRRFLANSEVIPPVTE